MKKIRFAFALVAMLGLGIGTAACSSPVSPSVPEYDLGSDNTHGYDLGSDNAHGYDLGSDNYTYDLGSDN